MNRPMIESRPNKGSLQEKIVAYNQKIEDCSSEQIANFVLPTLEEIENAYREILKQKRTNIRIDASGKNIPQWKQTLWDIAHLPVLTEYIPDDININVLDNDFMQHLDPEDNSTYFSDQLAFVQSLRLQLSERYKNKLYNTEEALDIAA